MTKTMPNKEVKRILRAAKCKFDCYQELVTISNSYRVMDVIEIATSECPENLKSEAYVSCLTFTLFKNDITGTKDPKTCDHPKSLRVWKSETSTTVTSTCYLCNSLVSVRRRDILSLYE